MRTYIKAGRLVDCTGADAIRSPVVLVEDGRIIQVGTSQTLEIPAGSAVIDCGDFVARLDRFSSSHRRGLPTGGACGVAAQAA